MAREPSAVIAAADLMTFARFESLVRRAGCPPHRHPLAPEAERVPGGPAAPGGPPLAPGSIASWPDEAAVLVLSLASASATWRPLVEAAHSRGMLVVGVGSHEETGRIAAARLAGSDRIVTNRRLPEVLPGLLSAGRRAAD